MAERLYFKATPTKNHIFEEHLCTFIYHSGFAVSQKQKSIADLHNEISKIEPNCKVLEVSTKSPNELGCKLSAFNIKFYDDVKNEYFNIENVFQSSKVFENGGAYRDLLYVHPKEAKRDERLKNSGKLLKFSYNDLDWELLPKTLFYDWIYINALYNDKELSKSILDYDIFTDIEFNQKKSINCQARSAAIFVSLSKRNELEAVINDSELLKKIYVNNVAKEK